MKKFLRFIGILLLILVVGYLVLCAVSDSELKVESTTTINAPKAVVFEQIVKFKNWEHWNAWKEMDTTVVVDVSGPDGQEGAKYHYVGKMTGEGTTTNAGVTDGEMKYTMDFIKPFPFKADGYYKVVEEGGKTKTTWYFHEDLGFFMRGMTAIMGAKKMLSKTFDRGLEMLKNYSETHQEDTAHGGGYTITDIQYPAHIYAGIRKTIKWADMNTYFKNSYGTLGEAVGQRISGPASALYFQWDTQNMQADVMACFPIADNTPVRGATIMEIPASAGYKIVYIGPYSGSEAAHNAMMQRIQEAGKTQKLAIEEYIKTPSNETDSNKYETNIIYLTN